MKAFTPYARWVRITAHNISEASQWSDNFPGGATEFTAFWIVILEWIATVIWKSFALRSAFPTHTIRNKKFIRSQKSIMKYLSYAQEEVTGWDWGRCSISSVSHQFSYIKQNVSILSLLNDGNELADTMTVAEANIVHGGTIKLVNSGDDSAQVNSKKNDWI